MGSRILFPPTLRSVYHAVESYGWRRCRPRDDEFAMYFDRHRRLQQEPFSYDPKRMDFAKTKMKQILSHFKCESIRLDESYWRLQKKTSPGYSRSGLEFVKLYRTKEDMPFREVLLDVKRYKKKGFIDSPSAIAFRSHMSRAAHKTRVVYVYPYAVCSLEGKYAFPLLDQLKNSSYSCPFGTQHNWLRGGFRFLKSSMRGKGIPMSVDFSSFDMSTKPEMIDIAFQLVRDCYSLKTSEEREWDLFVEYFKNTIVLHKGGYCTVDGGVPSGSVWTHIIGSIISLLLAYYAVPNLTFVKGFGDDLIVCSERPDLDDFIRRVAPLGYTVSAQKSNVGEAHWLGFNISGDSPRILDCVKRWAAFFHPDKPDVDMCAFKGRLFGYAMSSLGDPAFLNDYMTVMGELEHVRASSIDVEYLGISGLDPSQSTLSHIFKNVL